MAITLRTIEKWCISYIECYIYINKAFLVEEFNKGYNKQHRKYIKERIFRDVKKFGDISVPVLLKMFVKKDIVKTEFEKLGVCVKENHEPYIKQNKIKQDHSNVIKPNYYRAKNGQYDIYDIAEQFDLGPCLFNALKYMSRAGKKHKETELEDLEKAKESLNRQIEIVKARQLNQPKQNNNS